MLLLKSGPLRASLAAELLLLLMLSLKLFKNLKLVDQRTKLNFLSDLVRKHLVEWT